MPRNPIATLPAATAGEVITHAEQDQRQTEARFNERRELAIAEFGDGLPWSLEHYEAEIRNEMRRGCESFLRAGRYLIVVREHVAHGEWLGMLDRLGAQPRQAQRMMEAARRMAKLPNASHATHLIAATGTQSKLIELLSLPDDEFEELATAGATGDLTIDSVAKMTRDELRAAVRDARGDIDAKDARATERERTIEHLEKELRKLRGQRERATPDETVERLRDKCVTDAFQARLDITARGDGVASMAESFDALRAHAAEQGNPTQYDSFLAGLIGELLTELRVLRDTHYLPILQDHGDPNWMTGA